MTVSIRRAKAKDTDRIIKLLQEVLEIHAKIRPDIFISGTTKYNKEDLEGILKDETKPVYVAADDEDKVLGYAFCQIRQTPDSDNLVKFKSIFIDDLCVDESCRGQHIGQMLFEFVCDEARRLGCYEVTLNVWEGNDKAFLFYEKMGMKTKERQMEYIL